MELENCTHFTNIYYYIIGVAEKFMEAAETADLIGLRNFDPTIEEMSIDLNKMIGLLSLCDNDNESDSTLGERLELNAKQCGLIMERLVNAVSENSQEEFDMLLKTLSLHTKVP